MTRISGDSSWNKDLENTWDWTAVNTLVKFTTVNVNAVHINRRTVTAGRTRVLPAINALVKFTTVNINAVHINRRTVTSGRTRVLPAINALVKFTTVNVNAIHV